MRDKNSEYGFVLTPQASEEIVAVLRWWRVNRADAHALLRDELDRALSQLRLHPRSGVRAHSARLANVRRLLLLRSRYHLVYRIREGKRVVEVLALWHARRGGSPFTRKRRAR